MPLEIYTASGTFTWPESVTHVQAWAWGSGGGGAHGRPSGGGGGGGGAWAYKDIYRFGEESLSITVGPGGVNSVNGIDSLVVQNTTTVLKAPGGRAGSGRFGGAGGAAASAIGDEVVGGGNGGDGLNGLGGGGGSAGGNAMVVGEDGSDATTTAGVGGLSDGGGDGGDGGGAGEDGEDGATPGGGGGGGSTAPYNGGHGGDGKVVLLWGSDGITRFSAGCCCGQCDLVKGDMPSYLTLTWNLTPLAPEVWGFDPQNYDVPDYDVDFYLACEPDPFDPPTHVHHDSPGTVATKIEDYSFLNFVNGKEVQLELTDFFAGRGSGTGSFNPQDFHFGVEGHFCEWHFQCPLADASIDDGCEPQVGTTYYGFISPLNDRWAELGNSPHGTYDSPHRDAGPGLNCEPQYAYNWTRRGKVYTKTEVMIVVFRRWSDGKYFSKLVISSEFKHQFKEGIDGNFPDDGHGAPEPPGLTLGHYGWRAVEFIGPIEASYLDGIAYDTGKEALDAVNGVIADEHYFSGDPVQLGNNIRYNAVDGILSGTAVANYWLEVYEWMVCDMPEPVADFCWFITEPIGEWYVLGQQTGEGVSQASASASWT